MRRLFFKTYLALLAAVFVSTGFAAAALVTAMPAGARDPIARRLAAEGRLVATALEQAHAPEETRAVLARYAALLDIGLALWDRDGALLVNQSDLDLAQMPPPHRTATSERLGWSRGRPVMTVPAPGGWVTLFPVEPMSPPYRAGLVLLLGAALLGSVAYPLARHLTHRLERLEAGVERFGSGDLESRVAVEGADEVARLAERFNAAAAHIARLVEAQRRILASASHEFRSPLARIRMALELSRLDAPPEAAARLAKATDDVEELDALVGDVLLASRLGAAPARAEDPVDLGALLRDEASRVGAAVQGECIVPGDARMLRSLIRNLLENAQRHGGVEISAGVTAHADGAELWVADRGPGMRADLRERIFEPFFRAEGHREGRDGGVGLGLSLVRQIAEHHGGRAWCEPREGGGTLFRVRLGTGSPRTGPA